MTEAFTKGLVPALAVTPLGSHRQNKTKGEAFSLRLGDFAYICVIDPRSAAIFGLQAATQCCTSLPSLHFPKLIAHCSRTQAAVQDLACSPDGYCSD